MHELQAGQITPTECSTAINHAVVVTGYSTGGEEITEIAMTEEWVCEPYYVFWFLCEWKVTETVTTTPGSVPYFKVQNSWGTTWGQTGYMHIDMNAGSAQGVCGMRREIFGVEAIPWTW